MPWLSLLLGNWKRVAIVAALAAFLALGVKACLAEKKADENIRTGAVAEERAGAAAEVLNNVEKATDATQRSDPARDERLHKRFCRDCKDGE